MSFRFDSPVIAGAFHFGNRGLGVLGSEVPSSGPNGAGYIYADLTLPADANKEYSAYVAAPPAGLFIFEDTSYFYNGPSTSFQYDLKEDGVFLGTQTVTILVETPTASLSWAEASDTHLIVGSQSATLGWLEESDICNIQVALPLVITAAASWAEANDVFAMAVNLLISSSISVVEASDTHNITASIVATQISANLNITELSESVSATAFVYTVGATYTPHPARTVTVYISK